MAYNPNIPVVTNNVQDDLTAIRENFQHLHPLAEIVTQLLTVSGLAPVVDDLQTVSGLAAVTDELQTVSGLAAVADELQIVSGLAAVADELQTVSGLAPYAQAILASRVVEHNLDVPNPPNGWYVRWDNGLQICMGRLVLTYLSSTRLTATAQLPATFTANGRLATAIQITTEDLSGVTFEELAGAYDNQPASSSQIDVRAIRNGTATFSSGDTIGCRYIVVGRWK